MPHVETISYISTAPGATGTVATAVTGDSLTVKNYQKGGSRILAWWADVQLAGFQQMIFPSAHDQTRNYRIGTVASEVDPLLPIGLSVEVHAQETIQMTMAGSVTAGDIEQGTMVICYDDLPGYGDSGRFIDYAMLQKRTDKLLTVRNSITTGAGGSWTGAQLITAGTDLLKANRDYAVIGCKVDVECCSIGIRAPDWANMRLAVPGNETDDANLCINFFATMSRAFAMPLIPIFNSGNKSSIYIDALQDENAAAVPFSLVLALLDEK